MDRIESFWHNDLPVYPSRDIDRILNAAVSSHHDICRSFYLYRYLHRTPTPRATLTGDCYFAKFSKSLSELDSIPLTDAFADYLREDVAIEKPIDSYLDFVRGLPAVTGHGA